MRVSVICVGRPRGAVADLIAEYERRAERYFRFETIEVRETPHRGQPIEQLIADEGERLLARVPAQHELVALHRPGTVWSSERLAAHLSEAAIRSVPGVSFVIGGAFGLASAVIGRAQHQLSLSGMTLTHEIARLLLTEQLYRAGTIGRGEPYHKGMSG